MPGKHHFKLIVYATGTTTGLKIKSCSLSKDTVYYHYIRRREHAMWLYYRYGGTWASKQYEATGFTDLQAATKVAHNLSTTCHGINIFTTTKPLKITEYYYIYTKHGGFTYYYYDGGPWVKENPQKATEFTNKAKADIVACELRKQYPGAQVFRRDKSLKGN